MYLNYEHVSRYYTPINGNILAFEIIVINKPDGVLTPSLTKQRPGNRQFKIRGPFGRPLQSSHAAALLRQPISGSPLYHGKSLGELLVGKEGCFRNLVYIGTGSGVIPFIQFASFDPILSQSGILENI